MSMRASYTVKVILRVLIKRVFFPSLSQLSKADCALKINVCMRSYCTKFKLDKRHVLKRQYRYNKVRSFFPFPPTAYDDFVQLLIDLANNHQLQPNRFHSHVEDNPIKSFYQHPVKHHKVYPMLHFLLV